MILAVVVIVGSLQPFLEDTRGVDTIPLKMVVYLSITALVILLATAAWNNISPVVDYTDIDRQLEEAALKISSIQHGYAREVSSKGTDGSMCTVELSFPNMSGMFLSALTLTRMLMATFRITNGPWRRTPSSVDMPTASKHVHLSVVKLCISGKALRTKMGFGYSTKVLIRIATLVMV